MVYGRRRDYWLVAILASVVRLGVVLIIPLPAGLAHLPDSAEYDRLGRNLVERGRFSLAAVPPWTSDLTRTPVYPGFVAACYTVAGSSPMTVAIAQLLLGVGTCLLTYLAGVILLSRRAAVVAAGLLAVDPLSARYGAMLLSETLFTTLLLVGLVLAAMYHQRPGVGVACSLGVVLGLTTLCRPIAVFWPVVVGIWIATAAWRVRGWRPIWHAVLVVAIASLLTGGWMCRNYAVGGPPVLSTVPAINLYYHRAAAVLARQEGITEFEARQQLAERLEQEVAQERFGPRDEYRLMERRGLELIGSNQVGYLRACGDGLIRMMKPQEPLSILSCCPNLLAWVESAYLLVLYVLGGYGSVRWLVRSRRATVLVLGLGVTYFVILSGPEAYVRFRVPLMPLFALLAGSSFYQPVADRSPSSLASTK